jgi:predicted DNA-binding WGR domain protein
MTKRFEFIGGNSAKFWEVSQAGCDVTVRYGRLGTDGQQQSRLFPTSVAAMRHADKLVGQKLAKGYVEKKAA